MVGISYAILAHNETFELKTLLNKLIGCVTDEDEIIIVLDKPTDEILDLIRVEFYKPNNFIKCFEHDLNFDFAQQKNFLFSKCTKDYIFNIDADEYPSDYLLSNIKSILESNSDIGVFHLPRINKVNGITQEHILRWNWRIDENDWVNFPDFQCRLIRNNVGIHWEGKVHEKIKGFKSQAYFPEEEDFCLYHIKDIKKQEQQNAMYNKII
ncbi:MAG: glycosyltransferase [Candidatus Omnitrophica bacterium]|jgi:glycosyltransferase involved in cell wall biosynthesis|nr:glycosyltransferase [Candidatus Omnitrophota bacterium]